MRVRETVGGYPLGDRLITELDPPPPGPAPGAKVKPSSNDDAKQEAGDSRPDKE